jgi:diguanylate cyclase (GGDEF)-like protein
MRTDWAVSFTTGAVLVTVAYLCGGLEIPSEIARVTDLMPAVIGGLLVLLGWRFRRSRLALTAAVIATVDLLVKQGLGRGETAAATVEQNVLVILVSLNLALIAGVRSRRLLHPMVLAHAILIAAQPALVSWVLSAAARSDPATAWLGQVCTAASGALCAPEALLIAPLLAAAAIVVGMVLRRGTFESCLLWVLAASVLAILGEPERAQLAFPAAQLTLLAGFVESSYRLAYHDELTGLPGRRALAEALRTLGSTFAIGMVDIDHFKKVNDRHGHNVGDQVLRMVATRLAKVSGGTAYRYGGEEFAVIFPGLMVAEAAERMEAIRSEIAGTPFTIRSTKRPSRKPKRTSTKRTGTSRIQVTVSIGVSGPGTKRPDAQAVVQAADQALYRAKHRGRNRVVTSRG